MDALTQLWNIRGCVPSILPNRQMPGQNQVRESPLGLIDHTLTEITNFVSSTSRDVSGTSNPTPKVQQFTNGPMRESSMIIQGHLQLVAWTASGIPCKVEAFQSYPHSCVRHGATQNLLTLAHGEFGRNGAPQRVSIPPRENVQYPGYLLINCFHCHWTVSKLANTLSSPD